MTADLLADAAPTAMRVTLEAAVARDLAVTIVVVDDAGVLVQLIRMPGARALSVDLATRKAATAARTGRATHEWARMLHADPKLALAAVASLPDLVLFGGGIPVRANGSARGAVGVSGAAQEEDQELAELAVAAIGQSFTTEGEFEND